MLRIFFTLFFVFSFAILNSVFAQSTQLPGKPSDSIDGIQKTKILVLATPHLRQLNEGFSPVLLDSLITVLEKYNPDVIGIEVVSGSQLAAMERRKKVYKSILEYSGAGAIKYGKMSQEALSISWQKANLKADSLLKKVQKAQKVADNTRIELINYLLASYRFQTAALQWSYVSEKRKIYQSVIPKETTKIFGIYLDSSRATEIVSIALRLAHNLKLQQVYPIDHALQKDFYYSNPEYQFDKALGDSSEQGLRNASYMRKLRRLMEQGVKDSSLFAMYQFMNSPAYVEQDKRIQWRNTFLETEHFNKTLRQRLTIWQVRNLHMAANIRKASAHSPGGCVLIIIGGSHKAFLDSYLKQLMGVEVVDLSDITNN